MSDLWLCLRFPQLPLDLLRGGDGDVPRVIVEHQRVCFASTGARQAGIEAGMSLNTALALCKGLHSAPRDGELEAGSLRALAHWCYQFTPYVSLRAAQPGSAGTGDNDTILLEISRCLRLFHGLDNLLLNIHGGLRQQGYQVISSLGHTPQAAWLLGLNSDLNVLTSDAHLKDNCRGATLNTGFFLPRLQRLPLPLLPLADRQQQRLQNIGLQCLGELLALPRASLARRHGKSLAQQLDKISGSEPDLQVYIQPGQRFFAERHCLDGLTSVAMLEHPIGELLQEFQRFLTAGQMQSQGFQWRFLHLDRDVSELGIELSTAQNQRQNFLQLTRLKLHDFRIPSPIETVQLHSEALLASQARSRPLFHDLGVQSQSDRYQLPDTLRTRLGEDALYQLIDRQEHLPEYRQVSIPVTPARPGTTASADSPGTLPPLPLWLLPQPQPLRHDPQLQIISAAQRIDSHWWQRRQQRSYFIARDARGCHWIFYDIERRGWFLHGHFG